MPQATPLTFRRAARTGAGALAVAALSLSLLSTPAAAAVNAPENLQATTVPVLSWDRPSGATRYEVQLDNDPSFDSPEFTSRTVNTRAVPTKAVAGGTQYWRVRSFNASGTASPWSNAEFEAAPPGVPSGLTPDGDILQQPEEPPVLSWVGIPGATSYVVEVDADSDFIGATSYTAQTTSLVVPEPLEAGDYWWRVTAAKSKDIQSQPSAPATFDIEPLQPVVLTSPADDPDTQVEDVVLDWEPVAGAKWYQLRVARDADFNTIVDDQTKVFGTSYSPPITYNNAQYYWQVRAVDMAGKPTPWTTVQNSFARVWPDTPEPVWPLGEVDAPELFSGEPYFQWTPVQHASYYQLQVGSDPNFSPLTYDECLVAGTTYTIGNMTLTGGVRGHEKCDVAAGGITYWRVRALDRPYSGLGVQGIYSPTQAVVWEDPFITSMSPNGDVVDLPLLTWSGERAAESYLVRIKNQLGSVVHTKTTYSTSYVPLGSALQPGDFTWTVTAEDAAGRSSLIHGGSFTVTGDMPTTGAAPLTPLTGLSTDAPTLKAPVLSWEPDPDADYYKVSIGSAVTGNWYTHTNTDIIDQGVGYPAVVDTSKRFFSPGDYLWTAAAYSNTEGYLGNTEVETFHIAGFAPVQGQSIALEGGTLDAGAGCTAHLDPDGVSGAQCDNVPSSPVLSWDAQPGMSHYLVYVSRDSSFTNLLETTIPGTTGSRYALTLANTEATYADSQAGKSYFWFIRPCKAISYCGTNPVSTTGKATNAFRKLSPPVQLISPEDDADVAEPNLDTSEVTFTWEDYFDTAQTTSWDETGELDPEAGLRYRIQVDDQPNFSSPLDNKLVDQATYTGPDKLYPEGQLYWRVQAIDGDGKGLSWSETRAFVKRSPTVPLAFPIDDEVVSGTAALRWEPQPFNSSYRVEVYKNSDLTFSAANRLFFKDVTATAYSWDQPIPASSKAYVWRVRGRDAYNNWLPWSEPGRFFSSGNSPSLLAPEDGVAQEPIGPLFEWTSVDGATSYQLEVKNAGSTWLRTTTVATAFAPQIPVPDGTLIWKVTAFDARTNVIGTSGSRSFVVDASPPKIIKKTPTTNPKATANFIVKFSEPVTNVGGKTFKLYLKGKRSKLAAKVTVNAARTKATLNPKYNLKRGKTYIVKVTSGIKDDSGNRVQAASWQVTRR